MVAQSMILFEELTLQSGPSAALLLVVLHVGKTTQGCIQIKSMRRISRFSPASSQRSVEQLTSVSPCHVERRESNIDETCLICTSSQQCMHHFALTTQGSPDQSCDTSVSWIGEHGESLIPTLYAWPASKNSSALWEHNPSCPDSPVASR